MKKNGYSFEVGAVDVFVEKVGFETRRIYNEADKLMLFMNNEKKSQKIQLMLSYPLHLKL